MAPIGKIYSYPNNPRAFKCLIAAKYVGVQVDYPAFQFGTDNKTPAFLEKFPLGKVPCFETADGRPIFESNAIAHYIAAQKKEAGLLGNNAYEEALVQTWLNFADNEITPPAATWIYPFLGFIKYNKENTERAQADVKRSLGALDKWLASRTYLAAENITFADIAVTIALLPLFTRVLDAAARKQFVNVNRYMLTMVNQPNFIAVLGEVKFAEKVEVYDPAVHGQAAVAAASSSKKEKKEEKKEQKPKEEKKKEEKKPKKEEEEEPEESYEDEPKGKNPLDMLPPTKFKLDDFKRFYSNNAEADSIKYFWDNFDAEGYSIWRCDYKYNNENTKVYMTCNLLNGFFQRIDRVRKYGFGSFLIFGVDDDNEIKGRWVFRGQEVPAEVQEAADYESYEFEKLDHTNKEVRETFNAFLAWAEIDGLAKFHNVTTKKLDQGKIFK